MTKADLITHEINRLSDNNQSRVLEFGKALIDQPAGASITSLQRLTGSFSAEDLTEIEQAIEEDCNTI